MKCIYSQISDNNLNIKQLVIATVIRTQGSTPQKPGSTALFSAEGLVAGTIGGGVVEGRVQQAALQAINTGKSSLVTFDLYNDINKKEEAICGGKITVLIDARPVNSINVFSDLNESLKHRIPGVLVTMVTENDKSSVLVNRYWVSKKKVPGIQEEFLEKILPAAEEMISSHDVYDFREMTLSLPDQEPSSLFLLEPVFPADKLIIAGAGHIGRALSHFGHLLDFEVTVIDDRAEYANSTNIPDADHIIVGNIGKEMLKLEKTGDTYVVIVTRGHKDDAEALKPCIGKPLAYIGMIGSRKKVSSIRDNFIENGWATKETWDKVYSPIGLEIGSQTVEEIAVSIAAQLVKVRSGNR
jgi:xanthine dehydrogenase accessory factor